MNFSSLVSIFQSFGNLVLDNTCPVSKRNITDTLEVISLPEVTRKYGPEVETVRVILTKLVETYKVLDGKFLQK